MAGLPPEANSPWVYGWPTEPFASEGFDIESGNPVPFGRGGGGGSWLSL